MIAHERHQAILAALQKRSPLATTDLEKRLRASPATVRRDLALLEKLGKIVRTHGGVLHPEHATGELSFDRRSRAALKAKLALARAAVASIRGGDVVFVDAGTTTLEAGRRLLAMEDLTVFTNSIPLLNEPPAAGTRLIAVGGEVRGVSLALVGAGAVEWLRQVRVDVAFLGASGIEPAAGPSTTELAEAGVKRAILAQAGRVAVLADASKWGQPAAIRYAAWSQIHDFYTNHAITPAERAALIRQGTRCHVVDC
ncbi:MAG TPA: DeoR/GlpR family DNA-binding transcription regulator [Opitutaceae bacterium]